MCVELKQLIMDLEKQKQRVSVIEMFYEKDLTRLGAYRQEHVEAGGSKATDIPVFYKEYT